MEMSTKGTCIKSGKEVVEEGILVNDGLEVEGVVWEGSEDMGGDEQGRRAGVGKITTYEIDPE